MSTLQALIGGGLPEFLVLTVLLFGAAAAFTGQALAWRWRGARQLLLYAPLLAVGDRFLLYAIFGDPLLSLSGFILATLWLFAIGFASHRLVRAGAMVAQYPWLYRRAGPFGWRERNAKADS